MVSAISSDSRAGALLPVNSQQFQGIGNVLALPGSTTPRALATYTTLDGGRFEVVGVLARGSLGVVYEAFDAVDQRRVAIHELMPEATNRVGDRVVASAGHSAAFAAARERFAQEARRLQQVDHDGVVRVVGCFEANGTVYAAMDYVEGISLSEVLRRRGGPLTEAEMLDVLSRCAPAIGAVHRVGLVHRDICPENLLRTDDGRVVLIGFELGRPPADPLATDQQWSWYSAPETVTGSASALSDVFSLGATLYRLLAGIDTLDGPSGPGSLPALWRLNPTVSPGTSQAVAAAMSPDVRSRPGSAMALLRAVGANGQTPAAGGDAAVDPVVASPLEHWPSPARAAIGGGGLLAPVSLTGEPDLVIDITDRALAHEPGAVARATPTPAFDDSEVVDLRALIWPDRARTENPLTLVPLVAEPQVAPDTSAPAIAALVPALVEPGPALVEPEPAVVEVPATARVERPSETHEADTVFGQAPPGRWWVTVPLGLAAAAVTTAQPVSLSVVLGLVVAPALATVGDRILRPHRHRGLLPLWAIRNLLIASARWLGTATVLVVGMCLWFGTQGIDALAAYGPAVLRGTGLVAGGLLAVSISKGGAGFRSHLALDGLTRALAPKGRVTLAVVVLGLVCAGLVVAGLSFEPEAWPLR